MIDTMWQIQIADLLLEIHTIGRECSLPNWDEAGAKPVSESAVEEAAKLANSLPPALTVPVVCASPLGKLSFQWAIDHDAALLSVGGNGILTFAIVSATGTSHGSEVFSGFLTGGLKHHLLRTFPRV